jgi:hypothetical protein
MVNNTIIQMRPVICTGFRLLSRFALYEVELLELAMPNSAAGVVALTGHDLIQNVPQQTVNIVREDTGSDNSLVRQPTAGHNNRGQNLVTQTWLQIALVIRQLNWA